VHVSTNEHANDATLGTNSEQTVNKPRTNREQTYENKQGSPCDD